MVGRKWLHLAAASAHRASTVHHSRRCHRLHFFVVMNELLLLTGFDVVDEAHVFGILDGLFL
jgi:hypothetical protein